MHRLIAVGFCFVACSGWGVAADWTEFRGPSGSGVATGDDLPTVWSDSENVRWRAEVPGEGWACPIIVNGRVFIATAISDGEKSRESDTQWELRCYDADSGDELWTRVAKEGKPTIGTHRANTYASETPVTDGERVIVYFGMTGVYCYDMEGELQWQKDLGTYPLTNDWGTSSSPVLHDGMVFLQVDNEEDSFLVALDATSGEERWRQQRDEGTNWGSLVLWKNSVRTEVVANGKTVRSYDPATGDVLWSATTGANSASSTASASGDVLVVGGSSRRAGGGLIAVKAGASGDLSAEGAEGLLWRNSEDTPQWASPLVYDGCVYVCGGRGSIVSCLDAETGERLYRERLPDGGTFWASPFAFEGKVFCPADNGVTYVLKPGSEFELLGTNTLEGQFWSSAAMANGSVFIRSADALYCLGD